MCERDPIVYQPVNCRRYDVLVAERANRVETLLVGAVPENVRSLLIHGLIRRCIASEWKLRVPRTTRPGVLLFTARALIVTRRVSEVLSRKSSLTRFEVALFRSREATAACSLGRKPKGFEGQYPISREAATAIRA